MNTERYVEHFDAGATHGMDSDGDINEYIGRIGDRVKAIRARRGMTRKLLSEHSQISERYLSQVESGKANTSVALLWRIAHGMDVEISDLLPQDEHRKPMPSSLHRLLEDMDPAQQDEAYSLLLQHATRAAPYHGVALVGLRGAGKSALGELLSRETGAPFVDLVKIVEELSGMQVGELFSLGGQKAYGRMEQQALDHVLEHYPRAIVEAGGSLVTRGGTYQKLLRHYYTVWLKASPDEHMDRVLAQGDFRPMQGTDRAMEDLKNILTERETEYQAAHCVVDTSSRTVRSCLGELLDLATPYITGER